MRIIYKIQKTTEEIASILKEAISKEGVGFDSDFNSEATLLEDPNGNNEVIWETAFSQFQYKILEGSFNPFTLYKGESFVEYNGAERGFQQQNLLPDILRSGEILQVYGAHGCYEGPNALKDYSEKKKKDQDEVQALFKGELNYRQAFTAMAAAYVKETPWGHLRGLKEPEKPIKRKEEGIYPFEEEAVVTLPEGYEEI